MLGLEPDVAQWPTTDWAVRAMVEGLAGQNSTIWTSLTGGREQVDAAQRAVQTLGFRQVVIGAGAPGTATARLALVAPLREHLAGGGKLRGAFKSGAQRDAETVLEHSTVDGVPVTATEHVNLVCAALEAQACVETLGRGWAMVGVVVTGTPEEPVQQSVARVVDIYGRLERINQFLHAIGAVRQTLAAAKSWLPLANLAEWQEFVNGLDAGRLRVEAEQASAALARVSARLTMDARSADAPPELHEASAAIASRDAEAYAQALVGLTDDRPGTGGAGGLRRARGAAAGSSSGPCRAARGIGHRPCLAVPARGLGRGVGLGPGEHVLCQPAPARAGAAARGRAGGHDHPAAAGSRFPGRHPGLGALPTPDDGPPGASPARIRTAHAAGGQGHRSVRREVPCVGP